ncbi:MAG: hypothetical protein IKQ41_02610 [Clostridia bacterium]|nr:hypothetical protein [Clostridia bacterium]
MAWVLTILYVLLVSPLRAGILFRWKAGRADCRLGVLIWGARRTAEVKLRRDEKDYLGISLRSGRRERVFPLRFKRSGAWKNRWRKPGFHFLLRRLLPLFSVKADLCLGFDNAAETALLCGALNGVGALLPRVRLRCKPRYNGASSLSLLCIATARLGTIIALCLWAWMIGRRAGRKEENAWTVLSGT